MGVRCGVLGKVVLGEGFPKTIAWNMPIGRESRLTLEQRLERLDARQEHMISAIHNLTDVMAQTRDLVTELAAWLQEPPSSDLGDTLKAILEAVTGQSAQLAVVGQVLDQLPEQVARVMKAGEAS
jgi:ABC-type transporter Mla subunit MlaD